MNKKIRGILLLVLLVITGIFSGCSEKKDEKTKRDHLIVAQEGEPKSLDVHSGNEGYSLRINRLIYSRLVEADGDMKIQPGVAESWKQIDDRTTQFKLKKGLKFHNGYPLTAEDVKFSFERMKNSPRIAFVVPPIEKIDIIDDSTINIVTVKPFGPLLAHLSHPALGIVSKKLLTEDEESFKKHPIGSGPYKFVEWKPGEKVVLEKVEGNNSYFKNIIIKNVVESTARAIGLETKEYDVALSIASIDEKTIKENKNLKLITKPSISFTYVGMNNENEKFKDIRVRKAINYAIDKQGIIDAVLLGTAKIATSPIAPEVFGFTNKTKAYEFSIEKAKELLKEAGYENGFKTSIYISGAEVDKQTAEIIQANLREIGVDLEIKVLEIGAYWDLTSKGNFDMFLGSWGCVTGDADYGLYSMYHSKAKGAPGNRDFYSNEKVDKLLDEAKTTVDQEKRKGLYEEIQMQIVDDAADVMLYNRILSVGVQKDIEGLNIHPVTLHDFSTVYIK